jgi:hypothetical protein
MSIFLLPAGLSIEINSSMQRFWWGHKDNASKIHWMRWKKLGFSKTKGGLGFRDLRCFNRAKLAKQGWRLIHNPNNLAGQILKAKYCPRGSFLEATIGRCPSFAWCSILSSQELLKEGLLWRIGNRNSVKNWGNKWLPSPTTYAVQSPRTMLPMDATVSAIIDLDSRW